MGRAEKNPFSRANPWAARVFPSRFKITVTRAFFRPRAMGH
jgi:hypothetical protein